jgi:glycosyltransferase involved in cell wall biosynthesis
LTTNVVNGLSARGHHVTLFAHPHSHCRATLQPYGVPPHFTPPARARELWQVGAGLLRLARHTDAILSWGRLAALLPVLPLRRLPKLQCYQRDAVPWRSVRIASNLAGSSIRFAGCSSSVYREGARHGSAAGRWTTIFNGVDLAKYTAVERVAPDASLAFLGRLERFKGAHHAIAIARKSGRRLVIAGNKVLTGPDSSYFDDMLAPHIDGDQVRYIGPVDDAQKSALFGASAALLMPIEWDEPFGIVMAEALACGTPVVAFDRGSVPEVVRDGVNGFRCDTLEQAVAAVGRLHQLDRAAVRADCEARFSADVITAAYEQVLHNMVQAVRSA